MNFSIHHSYSGMEEDEHEQIKRQKEQKKKNQEEGDGPADLNRPPADSSSPHKLSVLLTAA